MHDHFGTAIIYIGMQITLVKNESKDFYRIFYRSQLYQQMQKKKNVVEKKVCISILTVIALQSEDIQQENLLHTNCLGQTGMCVFYKQGLKKI